MESGWPSQGRPHGEEEHGLARLEGDTEAEDSVAKVGARRARSLRGDTLTGAFRVSGKAQLCGIPGELHGKALQG